MTPKETVRMSAADNWNSRMIEHVIKAIRAHHDRAAKEEYEGQVIVKYSYTRPGSLNNVFEVNNRLFRVER